MYEDGPAQLYACLLGNNFSWNNGCAKYLQERRQIKGFRFRLSPLAKVYKEFGLYAIPQYAPYRRARMR